MATTCPILQTWSVSLSRVPKRIHWRSLITNEKTAYRLLWFPRLVSVCPANDTIFFNTLTFNEKPFSLQLWEFRLILAEEYSFCGKLWQFELRFSSFSGNSSFLEFFVRNSELSTAIIYTSAKKYFYERGMCLFYQVLSHILWSLKQTCINYIVNQSARCNRSYLPHMSNNK